MPPEYIDVGRVSKKSDVFSFGIVLLQTISAACTKAEAHFGRQEWEEVLQERGRMRELFDPTLVEESQQMDIERCVKVGLLCTHFDWKVRPTMADVLKMLNGKKELPAGKKRDTQCSEEEVA